MMYTRCLAVVGTLVVLAGCSAQESTADAPVVAEDAIGEQQIIYSSNANGSWSANSHPPHGGYTNGSSTLIASADFTGPAGKTRRMGVCLLELTNRPCTGGTQAAVDSQCGSLNVPPGGYRYCAAPDNAGQKYCAVRQGSPGTYCAGTPALGGAAVAPGSYATGEVNVGQGGNHISYGCFEGCGATDPSSSSSTTSSCWGTNPQNGDSCWDIGCDGFPETCTDSWGNYYFYTG